MKFLKAILLFMAAACLLMQSGCTEGNKQAKPPEEFAPVVENPSFGSITGGPSAGGGAKVEK